MLNLVVKCVSVIFRVGNLLKDNDFVVLFWFFRSSWKVGHANNHNTDETLTSQLWYLIYFAANELYAGVDIAQKQYKTTILCLPVFTSRWKLNIALL